MLEAFDLLAEARWETEGTRRAAQRYREAAAANDPAALPSGQKLLREVVPPLTEAIVQLQLKGADMLASRGGRAALWAIPIQLLDAGALAVITVTSALNASSDPFSPSAAASAVMETISTAVRDELDYRSWVKAQVAAKKAAREAQDWSHVDAAANFKARFPNADRRTWRRFRRKLELAEMEWDKETGIQLGGALLSALLETAPGRFELASRPLLKGRTQNYVKLSGDTVEMLKDIETRAEVARPMLMPMLMPPIPWAYE